MISRLYDTRFTVKRQVYSGNISTEQDVASFPGHIQQVTAEERIALGNDASLTHRIWCDVRMDVQASDKIVGDDGAVYMVSAVQRFPEGNQAHLELTVALQRELSV